MKCVVCLMILVIVLIGASGCGLSDYEKRMDAQRARVKNFDDFNALLDGPIAKPMAPGLKAKEGGQKNEKEDVAAWPFDVFLRLPKGYTTVSKERLTSGDGSNGFNCFRYSGGSEGTLNIFIAAAGSVDPVKETTGESYGKFYPSTFHNHLTTAVWKYYRNAVSNYFPQQKGKPQAHRGFDLVLAYPDPDLQKRVFYSSQLYTDEGNKGAQIKCAIEVFIFDREPGKQVGIVVHRPLHPANPEVMNKSIEACLATLDVSSEAAGKRALFKKQK